MPVVETPGRPVASVGERAWLTIAVHLGFVAVALVAASLTLADG